MTSSSNQSVSLIEMIFENRNKNYGAYQMRTNYEKTMLKSLLGLFLLITSLSVGFYLNSKAEIPAVKLPDLPMKELVYETICELKPIEEVVAKPIEKAASAAPSNAIATRIIDEPLVTNTVNLNVIDPGQGPSDAKGTSLTSSVVTTNTLETTTSNVANAPDVIHVWVQEMPEFEGGDAGLMKFISQHIVYPSLARELNVQGTVYVSFVVNEVGNVEQVKIIKGIGFGCDEEVSRVMSKIPKWKKVGKNDGRAVKVRYNVPVSFKLK